jgi:hypothetical protein
LMGLDASDESYGSSERSEREALSMAKLRSPLVAN